MGRWFIKDLAIDLGTANSVVASQGHGVVVEEPTVVAVAERFSAGRGVLAVGSEAEAMQGRTPLDITTLRPLHQGAVADFDATVALLKHLIAVSGRRLRRPRVALTTRAGLSPVEIRALHESARVAGAREVHLIPQAIAAALGAGLPVLDPGGHMLIDVGCGTTEISVISLGGVACVQSIPVGGESMNEAIIEYVKSHYGVLIGTSSAEQAKLALGAARWETSESSFELRGRDVVRGVPAAIELKSEEVCAAIADCVRRIVAALRIACEQTPPELSGDISNRGIMLLGGGARLPALDLHLREATNLSVVTHDEPKHAVALGAAMCLSDPALLARVALDH